MAFKGALVKFRSDQQQYIPDSYYAALYTCLKYNITPHFDTDGFFDTVKRDRLVIPPSLDCAWVRVHTSVRWDDTSGYRVQIFPSYYDATAGLDRQSDYPACDPDNRLAIGGTTTDHGSTTHPIQVKAGDYFRTPLWQSSLSGSGAPKIAMAGSFSIEVIG